MGLESATPTHSTAAAMTQNTDSIGSPIQPDHLLPLNILPSDHLTPPPWVA